jgi:hypothetical protein
MLKTLLVVTYVSFSGQVSVAQYPMNSMESCQQSGKQIKERVKAGKVSTLCKREPVERIAQL